jgi:hypothetical protein
MPAGAKPGERRGGRQKGTKNSAPAIRTLLEESLTELGGVKYLVKQGTENPKSYMALLSRAMPMQVQGDSTAPLTVQIVKFSSDS